MSRLTIKQRKFIDAYMGEAKGNATEAARLAGYSGSDQTLRAVGYENLTKPHIRSIIEQKAKEDPLIATREDRQQFWTEVMQNPNNDMRDRLRASEILGKSQADFVERHEHTHDVTAQVVSVKGVDIEF